MQNWGIKPEASHAIASRSQPHRAGYHHHQQSCFPDGQRDNSTYNHPGKHVDNKLMQNSRQTAVNGGSGVRVVFLGSSTGRESGTGVFLPRVFDQRKAASARQNGECQSIACQHCRLLVLWVMLFHESNDHIVRRFIFLFVSSSELCHITVVSFKILTLLINFYCVLQRTTLTPLLGTVVLLILIGMPSLPEKECGLLCSKAVIGLVYANPWFTSLVFHQNGPTSDHYFIKHPGF